MNRSGQGGLKQTDHPARHRPGQAQQTRPAPLAGGSTADGMISRPRMRSCVVQTAQDGSLPCPLRARSGDDLRGITVAHGHATSALTCG